MVWRAALVAACGYALVGRSEGQRMLRLASVLGDRMVLPSAPLPAVLWGSADGIPTGLRVLVRSLSRSCKP
jgi:hypothetical protein